MSLSVDLLPHYFNAWDPTYYRVRRTIQKKISGRIARLPPELLRMAPGPARQTFGSNRPASAKATF